MPVENYDLTFLKASIASKTCRVTKALLKPVGGLHQVLE
jgi:hypothetical protein